MSTNFANRRPARPQPPWTPLLCLAALLFATVLVAAPPHVGGAEPVEDPVPDPIEDPLPPYDPARRLANSHLYGDLEVGEPELEGVTDRGDGEVEQPGEEEINLDEDLGDWDETLPNLPGSQLIDDATTTGTRSPAHAYSVAIDGDIVEAVAHMWMSTTHGAAPHQPVPEMEVDGDGQTDIAIYDNVSGWWHLLTSANRHQVIHFGRRYTDIPLGGADYDGDGRSDLAIWRPAAFQLGNDSRHRWGGSFAYRSSATGAHYGFPSDADLVSAPCRHLGPRCPFLPTDVPVVARFSGSDGTPRSSRFNFAVFRPASGQWVWLRTDNQVVVMTYGTTGDVPAPADYDGDRITDVAVYRPGEGRFYIRPSTAPGQSWTRDLPGVRYGVVPVPADYDGNGAAEPAVFRSSDSTWHVYQRPPVQFGAPAGAVPVAGRWDRDGRADFAVYHPAGGSWFYVTSRQGGGANWFYDPNRGPGSHIGPLGWGAPVPRPRNLCPGVIVDAGGYHGAARGLQACIGQMAPNTTLAIPPGMYKMNASVQVPNHVPGFRYEVRTAGAGPCWTRAGYGSAALGPEQCAHLIADPAFTGSALLSAGPLKVNTTQVHPAGVAFNVVFNRLVVDGNRQNRMTSHAASRCRSDDNSLGNNLGGFAIGGEVSDSVSMFGLCGTALGWNGANPRIVGNLVRDNGEPSRVWSDGVTMTVFADSPATGYVRHNVFADNTDVDLVLFGGAGMHVAGNEIHHLAQPAFAGIMLDNLGSNREGRGDFRNAIVEGNFISGSGHRRLDFGINLGPWAWYPGDSILGGTVRNNTIHWVKQGINIDGAGVAGAPIAVYGNAIANHSTGLTQFRGCVRNASAIHFHAQHSVVCWSANCIGGPPPGTTESAWHGCV